jgi:hypothetical protein
LGQHTHTAPSTRAADALPARARARRAARGEPTPRTRHARRAAWTRRRRAVDAAAHLRASDAQQRRSIQRRRRARGSSGRSLARLAGPLARPAAGEAAEAGRCWGWPRAGGPRRGEEGYAAKWVAPSKWQAKVRVPTGKGGRRGKGKGGGRGSSATAARQKHDGGGARTGAVAAARRRAVGGAQQGRGAGEGGGGGSGEHGGQRRRTGSPPNGSLTCLGKTRYQDEVAAFEYHQVGGISVYHLPPWAVTARILIYPLTVTRSIIRTETSLDTGSTGRAVSPPPPGRWPASAQSALPIPPPSNDINDADAHAESPPVATNKRRSTVTKAPINTGNGLRSGRTTPRYRRKCQRTISPRIHQPTDAPRKHQPTFHQPTRTHQPTKPPRIHQPTDPPRKHQPTFHHPTRTHQPTKPPRIQQPTNPQVSAQRTHGSDELVWRGTLQHPRSTAAAAAAAEHSTAQGKRLSAHQQAAARTTAMARNKSKFWRKEHIVRRRARTMAQNMSKVQSRNTHGQDTIMQHTLQQRHTRQQYSGATHGEDTHERTHARTHSRTHARTPPTKPARHRTL